MVRLSSSCILHVGLFILHVSAVLLCCSAHTSAGEIALATELKVSGPVVTVRAPLGLRYRPGYPLPLQVRVHNPGAAFNAELFV
ncbi:MAG: hypothetical protein NTW87_22060, partial [Planctomycetota bacterium]|nr:hypothetical protein [Planctomycetota bacterium]